MSGSRETGREMRDRVARGRCGTGLRAGGAGQGCAWEMRERGCALECLREREHVQAWGCNGEWLSWTRD